MSLWTVILSWAFSRFAPEQPARRWALWVANVLAAFSFAAAHLGTAVVVADVSTPLDLPPMMLVGIIVLNGFVGVLAGLSFARNGLVGAAGVHFWADVVWHVLFGALSGAV
jgi:membrane protease YdiL (CAAX protease family)